MFCNQLTPEEMEAARAASTKPVAATEDAYNYATRYGVYRALERVAKMRRDAAVGLLAYDRALDEYLVAAKRAPAVHACLLFVGGILITFFSYKEAMNALQAAQATVGVRVTPEQYATRLEFYEDLPLYEAAQLFVRHKSVCVEHGLLNIKNRIYHPLRVPGTVYQINQTLS